MQGESRAGRRAEDKRAEPRARRSAGGRWILIAVMLLAVIAAGLGFSRWASGREWYRAEHERNYADLSRVTRAIEGWPAAVDRLARSQLIRARLEPPPDAAMREHGWHMAARVDHPEIGPLTLHYRLADSARSMCVDETVQQGRIADNSGIMNLIGEVSLRGLWYEDQGQRLPLSDVPVPGAAQFAAMLDVLAPGFGRPPTVPVSGDPMPTAAFLEQLNNPLANDVCPVFDYRVSVPLERMANLATNGPGLSAVLLLDADGRTVARYGRSVPPVGSDRELFVQDDEYRRAVEALIRAATKSDNSSSAQSRESAREDALQSWLSGKPIAIMAGGERYFSYIRPIRFDRAGQDVDLAIANCGERGGRSDDKPAEGSKAGGAGALRGQCALVALVRADEVRERAFTLPTATFAALGLLLVLTILLVPVLKLRFLGPGGNLSPLEVGAALFGLVGATAVSALLLLLIGQSAVDHARMRAQLETSARIMAAEVRDEVRGQLALPALAPPALNGMPPDAVSPYPDVSPAIQEAHCLLPAQDATGRHGRAPVVGAAAVHPSLVPVARFPGDPAPMPWPLRNATGIYAELGGIWPGTQAAVWRCNSGARANVAARPYFRRLLAGQRDGVIPANTREQACLGVRGMERSVAYTMGAVRAVTDGIPTAVIASLVEQAPSADTPRTGWIAACPGASGPPVVPPIPAQVELSKIQIAAGSGMAFDCGLPRSGEPGYRPCPRGSAPANPATSLIVGPPKGVMVQSFQLRAMLRPTLPPGQQWVVIDPSTANWAYLFGTHPGRIGTDGLKTRLLGTDAEAAVALVRQRQAAMRQPFSDPLPDAVAFRASYEGQRHQFVAHGMPGTPWVLLVHQPLESLDRPLARTVSDALLAWMGLALVAGAVLLVLAVRRPLGWRWAWPRPGRHRRVAAAARMLFGIAAMAIIAPLAAYAAGFRIAAQAIATLLPLVLPLAALLLSWRAIDATGAPRLFSWLDRLLDRAPAAGTDAPELKRRHTDVLRPRDETAWRRLLVAVSVTLGAAIMVALFVDARVDGNRRQMMAMQAHYAADHAANRTAIRQLVQGFGLLDQPQPQMAKAETAMAWLGLHGARASHEVGGSSGIDWSFMRQLRTMAGDAPPPDGVLCRPQPAQNPATAGPPRYCVDNVGRVALVSPPRELAAPSGWVVMALVLTAAGLFALGAAAHAALVRGLFGFGVPLEAVEYPEIGRDAHGALRLEHRSVVLNPPQAMIEELRANARLLDLATPPDQGTSDQLKTYLAAGGTLLVVGLDLVLKDGQQRRDALATLQDLTDTVRAARRGQTGTAVHSPAGRIVVLTDLSPLDRILQAFEREQHDSDRRISSAEQLQWSRLFEDYTTYSLPPVPKFRLDAEAAATFRTDLLARGHYPGEADGILTLLDELRWLPESAIDALLDADRPHWAAWVAANTGGAYPLTVDQYHAVYSDKLRLWAERVRPVSRPAAVDFLRGMLIEHYQHLWAASSHAERLIMDTLARGRMVNLRQAVAIRSLVRRGIVRLDPEPQLMNHSIRAFIVQAERPQTIASYRSEQAPGGWDQAMLPLAILLPLLTAGAVALAAVAGIPLTGLMPLLFSSGPAAVGVLSTLFRRG